MSTWLQKMNPLQWISNLFAKWTGSGLTSAQEEQNQFARSERLDSQRFSQQMAEDQWERETEFYEKNQSISAQLQQMKDFGVNPYSLGSGGVNVGSAPSVSPPHSSPASPTSVGSSGSLSDIFSAVMQAKDFSIRKSKSDAEANYYNALAEEARTRTPWIDRMNQTTIDKMISEIGVNHTRVDEMLQSIKESASRIDVNNSTIEINGARISLMGSQETLNASQEVINKLTAQQVQDLLPYVKKIYEANSEKAVYDAEMSMLKSMVERGLIDDGYYKTIVEQAQWESKGAKRSYKWKPVNDVCSNVSKICVGAASVIGSLKGGGPTPSLIQTYSQPITMQGLTLPQGLGSEFLGF